MKPILKLWVLTCAIGMSSSFIAAQDLYPDKNEKGKWGYIDNTGKKVIDYKFDEARNFENGKALVRKGDNYGMIGIDSKEIIPIKYNIIERHNDNIYRVAAGGKMQDGVLFNEKYGFVDASGKEILKPEYEEIGLFNNGLAYIKKGNVYGYINDRIESVIPCKYNAVGSFNKDGYVWVCEGASFEKNSTSKFSGGKYGIFDSKGNIIVPVKYKTAGSFIPYVYQPSQETLEKLGTHHKNILQQSGSHHLYRKWTMDRQVFSKLPEDAVGFYASNKSDGYKNAVFNLRGDLLIKDGKYETAFYPTDGMALILDKKNKHNYLNVSTGKMLFKKPIETAWAFEDGVAVVSRDGKGYELIDLEGGSVSSTYKNIFPRKEGVYIVQSDADPQYIYYGVIDPQGREIVTPRQSFIYPAVNGMMACREGDAELSGYRDTKGKWVIEPKFKTAQSFKYGLADVMTEKGWGLIDPTGKEVVKCRWPNSKVRIDGIDGYMWVSDDEGDDAGFMLLKISTDEVVSTEKYKWVRNVGTDFEGIALVGSDKDHIGIFTTEGKLIIPTVFNFNQAMTAYNYLVQTGRSDWEEFDTYRVKLYSNPNRNKAKLTHKIESSLWDY